VGLPNLRAVRRVLHVGDDWDIATVDTVDPLPCQYRNVGVVLTKEECEQYKPKIVKFHYGQKFLEWVDFKTLWDLIQECFPFCYKRIGRAFWGRWNTRQSVEMISWGGGMLNVTPLKNPFHNPIWSHYIVSRVAAKCLAVPGLLHLSHDSVLTPEELPTGNGPGEWRCEHELDKLFIVRTNLWGNGGEVLKHSGMTSGEVAKWQIKKA
jgi:hypothetical protein